MTESVYDLNLIMTLFIHYECPVWTFQGQLFPDNDYCHSGTVSHFYRCSLILLKNETWFFYNTYEIILQMIKPDCVFMSCHKTESKWGFSYERSAFGTGENINNLMFKNFLMRYIKKHVIIFPWIFESTIKTNTFLTYCSAHNSSIWPKLLFAQ